MTRAATLFGCTFRPSRGRATARLALGAVLLWGTAGCAANPVPQQFLERPQYESVWLQPGDALRITVWQREEFSGEFVIGADSALVHPVLQDVEVVGPLSSVRFRLGEALRVYDRDPKFTVEPLFPVYVGGAVGNPSLYMLPWGTTVSGAIAEAGGPNALGRLDKVRFVRRGYASQIDLWDTSSTTGGIWVRSGDELYVGARSQFNLFQDLLRPVGTLLSITLSILVLADRL